MARRYRFGGVADYVIAAGDGGVATLQPGVTVTCWNADSGGTQITDLTLVDGATPILNGELTADANGSLPEFMGPVGVTWLYIDGNGGSGPRERTVATDLGDDVITLDGQVNGSGGLAERMATAESNIESGGGGGTDKFPGVVVPNGFDDAAVQAAMAEVIASADGNQVRKRLVLKPGVYNLSTPLIAQDAGTLNVLEGLQVEGAGISSTVINWNGGSTPFITAVDPRLRYFKFKGFTVTSQNSASVFAYLYSTAGGVFNQRWHLEDVRFGGAWTRGFGLDGGATANLNSEFTFNRVETNPTSSWSDAFFWSGMQNASQENQFLNYWFQDCNFSLSSGTVFRFTRGGSVTFLNGSWSANSSSNTITWFDLPTSNSNNPAQCQIKVIRVRFEPKGAGHKILNCNWADAFIDFDTCSDTASSQNSGSYVHERYTVNGNNIWGGWVAPIVRFKNHAGGGIVKYTGGAQTRGGFIFDGCKPYRGDTGQRAYGPQTESGAAVGTTSANPVLQWSSGAPKYSFLHGWNYRTVASWPDVA